MTNSENTRPRAAEIIQRIQATLAETPWQAAIDQVIDETLVQLEESPPPVTPRQLIDHVAATLRQIHVRLPNTPRRMSEPLARDEAAYLVGLCSSGDRGEGFDSVLLSIADDNMHGMESLYRQLGELLKDQLRRSHVNWAFNRHLDPSDWETNLAVAEDLLAPLRASMPDGSPQLHPEEFVDCVADLFSTVQNVENAPLSVLLDRLRARP